MENMKITNLDHIENFIQASVQKHMADLGILRVEREDKIGLHQLIVDYLEHPLMKKLYIKAAIFEYNNHIFVKTLRPLDVENYAKADLEDIYQLNKALIESHSKISSYEDFKTLMDSSCQWQKFRDDNFPISIIQSVFPDVDIPRTALSQVSMVNENIGSLYQSSKRQFLEQLISDDDYRTIEKGSIVHKKDHDTRLVSAVKKDLANDNYYRLFFSNKSLAKQRSSISLHVETIDKSFLDKFCHSPTIPRDSSNPLEARLLGSDISFVNKDLLKDDYGMIYCGEAGGINDGCTAVYATNEFNELAGLLIIGKKLFPFEKEGSHLNEDAHYLKSVAVHRSFRGQGISMKLFQKAIELAKEKHWVIVRTLASEDGSEYIESKFDRYLVDHDFPFIVNHRDGERAREILQELYKDTSTIPRDERWKHFQKEMKEVQKIKNDFFLKPASELRTTIENKNNQNNQNTTKSKKRKP